MPDLTVDEKLDIILETLEEIQETQAELQESIANLSLPGSGYSIIRPEED